MKEEEIPGYNIFMMCERVNRHALTDLNTDYYFRNCLKEFMPKKDFDCLKIIDTPDDLIKLLEGETTIQF